VLFGSVLDGSERINNIVQELRDFAREGPAELTEAIESAPHLVCNWPW